MRKLSTLRWGIRLWLLLYSLSLGLAVAAPMVKPQQFSVICTSVGILKYVALDDDPQGSGAHVPDCPLCVTATAPSEKIAPLFEAHAFNAVRVTSVVLTVVSAGSAPPLPARGPPTAV